MKHRFTILSIGLVCLRALPVHAAPGDLDPSFGTGGKVTADFGNTADRGWSVALQSDGKIVVAGNSFNGSNTEIALARHMASGALDAGFGTGGKVTTLIDSHAWGRSVAVQSDGKIVVAGQAYNGRNWDFALVRYTVSGALDGSFGTGGKVTTAIGSSDDIGYSVALQGDGKIVVAGASHNVNPPNYDIALVRYTASGALDSSFGTGGKVATPIGSSNEGGLSVALQSDGKIVVAGYYFNGSDNDFALVRYTASGALDASFGTGGKVTTTFASSVDAGYSVAMQSDGKIVVAGFSRRIGGSDDFALARYTANGALDPSFGTGGKVTTPNGIGYSVAVQSDGKIVVAGEGGTGYQFRLARYTASGGLDTGFGTAGKVTGGGGQSLALQRDGKILVAGGDGDFVLVRYLGDPGPSLNMLSLGAGQATISWTPATAGFVLQETLSLSPVNWTNAPSGETNPVTVPATETTKFYRLYKP